MSGTPSSNDEERATVHTNPLASPLMMSSLETPQRRNDGAAANGNGDRSNNIPNPAASINSPMNESWASYGAADSDSRGNRRLSRSQILVNRIRSHTTMQQERLGKIHHLTEAQERQLNAYESLDYEIIQSEVYQEDQARRWFNRHREEFMRWLLTFVIGFTVGLIAFTIDFFIRHINDYKFEWTHDAMGSNRQNVIGPFFLWVFMNTALAGIGSLFVVFGEAVAAGSGIPEIKSYLNGVKVPHIVRLKTLVCKATGVLFSVSGGLPIGKEGPMIHSGAIVAAGISQLGAKTCHWELMKYYAFHNDHDKRDFVAAGAASGVAAAFGAPTGGTLFSLEEAASFWNQPLTWRTFFCAMISTFTLNFFLSGAFNANWGDLSQPGLITFGQFRGTQPGYKIWEVPFFLVLGVVGGLLGALFNWMNTHLTLWRQRYVVGHRYRQLSQVLVIAATMAALSFLIPYWYPNCRLPTTVPPLHGPNVTEHQFYCDDGYTSETASLFFSPQEEAIKGLFHKPKDTGFRISSILSYMPVYYMMAVVTYGVAVPSGLFVPCLMIGAAYGRIFGHVLYSWTDSPIIDPGTYALIGAASFLGGVARMTISITVILLEATNDIQYGLPLMITIMVSKLVGDVFNKGLYDIHVELKHVPFLEWNPERQMGLLKAKDVMARKVVCVHEVEQVKVLINILRETKHNGFPVMGYEQGGRARSHTSMHVAPSTPGVNAEDHYGNHFCGMVLRHQLNFLLAKKLFQDSPHRGRATRVASMDEFSEMYPRFPKINTLSFTEAELEKWVDMGPYLNPYPVSVYEGCPLDRVFRIFRSVGLRHVCVVDSHNHISGIITRKELLEHKVEEAFRLYEDEESLHMS